MTQIPLDCGTGQGETPGAPLGEAYRTNTPYSGPANVPTFGNKGARPAQRGGAAGCGVTAKKGLRLIHEKALVLIQRGRLHRQQSGILKFRVGAGDGARAKGAGAHRESQLVGFQLEEETNKNVFYYILQKLLRKK